MEFNKAVLKKLQLGVEPFVGLDAIGDVCFAEKINSKIKTLIHIKPEPFIFSGSNLKYKWRAFRKQFEDYLENPENENKTSEERVALLLSLFDENGRYLFHTFKLDDAMRKNLAIVLACYDNYCTKKKNIIQERYLLHKRVHEKGEPIAKFLKDITFKIKFCEYEEQEESVLRDLIVAGVRDKNLQEQMIEKEVDLRQAIEMLMEKYKKEAKRIEDCYEDFISNCNYAAIINAQPGSFEISPLLGTPNIMHNAIAQSPIQIKRPAGKANGPGSKKNKKRKK